MLRSSTVRRVAVALIGTVILGVAIGAIVSKSFTGTDSQTAIVSVQAGAYDDYGNLGNTGPRCASTATINSFQFLMNKYPDIVGGTKLIPGAGTDNEDPLLRLGSARNALHDGWKKQGQPRSGVQGECLQAKFGKHRRFWWEAKAQWIEDFAEGRIILDGMVFTGGLDEPDQDPTKWKFGSVLKKGAPTWDFLWQEISHGEDVEIAFADKEKEKPTADHAVTLVGLSDDGQTRQITYIDPNNPNRNSNNPNQPGLFTATLTTSTLFGGSLGFRWDNKVNDPADVAIYLAYSESPIRPHYKSYMIDGDTLQNVVVNLRTQFGVLRAKVMRATHLLAPALKNHTGGPDEVDKDLNILQKAFPHLKCYFIRSVQRERPLKPAGVLVELNPLNRDFRREPEVQVGVPAHLCTPAAKSNARSEGPPDEKSVPSVPHYLCYAIADQDAGIRVRINTQFGEERTMVHKARGLCVPALKNPTGTEREQLRELDKLQTQFPHLKCYEIDGALPERNGLVHLRTQFSLEERVRVGKSQHLCVPVEKKIRFLKEVDTFFDSIARITIEGPFGSDIVTLSGPTIVVVNIENVTDSDKDGLEEVETQIVHLELSGTSKILGPITLRHRATEALGPVRQPDQLSMGKIEERVNNIHGVLEIPPFTPTGTADSFFDVFFEIELLNPPALVPRELRLLHNETPKHMRATITHKPPRKGETYESPEVIELFDESGRPSGVRVRNVSHTPNPELPDFFVKHFIKVSSTRAFVELPLPGTIQAQLLLLRPAFTFKEAPAGVDSIFGLANIELSQIGLSLDPKAGRISGKVDIQNVRSLGGDRHQLPVLIKVLDANGIPFAELWMELFFDIVPGSKGP